MSTKQHLVLEDRKQIESMLNENVNFTKIGKTIGKSTSTVSREVKSHRIERSQTPYGRIPNRCKNSFSCTKRDICAICKKREHPFCRTCGFCNQKCPDFTEALCPKLDRAPFALVMAANRSAPALSENKFIGQRKHKKVTSSFYLKHDRDSILLRLR